MATHLVGIRCDVAAWEDALEDGEDVDNWEDSNGKDMDVAVVVFVVVVSGWIGVPTTNLGARVGGGRSNLSGSNNGFLMTSRWDAKGPLGKK